MSKELIKKLRELDIVDEGKFVLANGEESHYYINIKKAFGDPDALSLMTNELWGEIDDRTNCIAAAGYGGIPLATSISLLHGLNLTLVRNTPKKHGREVLIDGHLPTKGDKVSIVDDVFTTGGSLKEVIEVLEHTGAEVLGCHVVVKRGEGELKVPFNYLMKAEELL